MQRMFLKGLFVLACALTTTANAKVKDGLSGCPIARFETDFSGRVISGSKARLIAAIESGEKVRVGWRLDFNKDGKADLTHWADANFLTIFEGEVFAQVDAIQRQEPMQGKADVRLYPGQYMEWRGSIGTNGTLRGVMSNGVSGPDNVAVATTWCV
jgi:hypothetical protein